MIINLIECRNPIDLVKFGIYFGAGKKFANIWTANIFSSKLINFLVYGLDREKNKHFTTIRIYSKWFLFSPCAKNQWQ